RLRTLQDHHRRLPRRVPDQADHPVHRGQAPPVTGAPGQLRGRLHLRQAAHLLQAHCRRPRAARRQAHRMAQHAGPRGPLRGREGHLVTVIDSYLDTLFAPYPDSPRLREARAELRALMEDQQQALMDAGRTESQAVGAVIAEFGSLDEVAAELGITAELDGTAAGTGPTAPAMLSIERAEEYVEAVRRGRWVPAVAIPMFGLSALPLLLLIAVGGEEPSGWALGAGLTALLVLVAVGVVLLVLQGSRMEEFEDIDEARFSPTPAVREIARDLRREHRREQIGRASCRERV